MNNVTAHRKIMHSLKSRHARAGMTKSILSLLCVLAWFTSSVRAAPLFDPTRPANATAPMQSSSGEPALRIEAILRCAQRCVAIIDGKLVHAGEHIADVFIEQISSDTVRYTRNGKTRLGTLEKTTLLVRQPARQEK